jgi:hypothetical protein
MVKTLTEKRDQAERLLRYLKVLSGIAVQGRSLRSPPNVGSFRNPTGGQYRDARRLGALGHPESQWYQNVRKLEFSPQEIESALFAIEQRCRLGSPSERAVGCCEGAGPPFRIRAACPGVERRTLARGVIIWAQFISAVKEGIA